MFPKGDTDRLEGADGYFVWALRMKNVFEYCGHDWSDCWAPDGSKKVQGLKHKQEEGEGERN